MSSQPGSEVQIALQARQMLQREGTSARVASVPWAEWFSEQDASYQQEVQTRYAEFGISAPRAAAAARTSLARQSAGAGD